MGQVLFDVHVEGLSFTLPLDDLEIFVVHLFLHFLHLCFQFSYFLVQVVAVELVLSGLGPEVFSNHAVFVEKVLVADLNGIEFLLKFVDILLLGHFHLLQDFLLSMQLAIEVFSFGD